jgi:DNA integrity scanning protein DisA with diadenylate cyclase activity
MTNITIKSRFFNKFTKDEKTTMKNTRKQLHMATHSHDGAVVVQPRRQVVRHSCGNNRDNVLIEKMRENSKFRNVK